MWCWREALFVGITEPSSSRLPGFWRALSPAALPTNVFLGLLLFLIAHGVLLTTEVLTNQDHQCYLRGVSENQLSSAPLLWQPAGGVCLALSRVTVPVCFCRGSVEHLQSLCKPNVPKVRKGFHAVGQASTLSQKALDSQILSNAKIVVTTINSMHIPPCSRKYYIGTLWSWATDLASLKLSFLICNLGAKSSFHCFENEMIWPYQLRLFLSQAIETQSVSGQAERAINYK